jgi:hypothetical protein
LLLFRTIHDLAVMVDRERAGREASPSAGIIDSQSVKRRWQPSAGHCHIYQVKALSPENPDRLRH